MRHPDELGYFGQGLASGSPAWRFSASIRRKAWTSAEPNATGLSSGAALGCTSKDQMPFELGKAAQHSHHQSAMWGSRVRPAVPQRLNVAPRSEIVARVVEQIASAAR
jgi:hypothetical protein